MYQLSHGQGVVIRCFNEAVKQGLSSAELTEMVKKELNVTRQRVHQLFTKLDEKGFIDYSIFKTETRYRNKRIGNLTLIERTKSKSQSTSSGYVWKCVCDCGGLHFDVPSKLLSDHKAGVMVSCNDCFYKYKNNSTLSGATHVYFTEIPQVNNKSVPCYKVKIESNKIKKERLFSIKKHGLLEAFTKAIQQRDIWKKEIECGKW